MSDLQDATASSDGVRSSITDDIARSLGSVWQRHDGGKPASITTEISGDTIRCTLEAPLSADDDAPQEFYEGSNELVRSPESSRYRDEASAVVSRLTGRRVLGFISKREPKSNVTTDTFILERRRVMN